METMLRTGIEQCPKTLGSQVVLTELRKGCEERLTISEEFLQSCLVNSAGGEVMNRIRYSLIMFAVHHYPWTVEYYAGVF